MPRRAARALLLVGLAAACTPSASQRLHLGPPTTVAQVDLDRYLGTWYEIASFPQRYQAGCVATQATYSRRDDGRIDVANQCLDQTLDGRKREARGLARLPDPADTAKLEVSFFRPFWGDYWVLELGPDYSHAVVGAPSRDALWILSRSRHMDADVYAGIVGRAAAQGFEVDRLQTTLQAP